ncbi:MAG: dephospho-CoA kinase [Clostridia bacterium]|nr:dephospho-CoA kinase [Clostridia bacterium]MBQ8742791.1 dephospho-CoA kinase [Clostridia bacterium]MBQ9749094.1 dephospho-CoA kinase [Clostridia bacterium]
MKIIGLTGNSGSGKGYVCSLLEKYSVRSVDADSIVHLLYRSDNECKNEMRDIFGDGIFDKDQNIDRKKLAALVFSDRTKLELLNKTVHKYVIKHCEREIMLAKEKNEKAIVIDAPQLFEAGMDKDCDFVISVVADTETCVERIIGRDKISRDDALKRLKNQHTRDFFEKRSDYLIFNDQNSDVEDRIKEILLKENLI